MNQCIDQRAGWIGIALVVLAALSVGVCLILTRVVLDSGAGVVTVIALRFTALATGLWFWARARGRSLEVPPRLLLICYLLGILFLLHTGGMLMSIMYIPVSLAILIFYTYPLLTALFTSITYQQAPCAIATLSLLASLCGLAIAVETSLDDVHILGVGLAFAAAVAAAALFTASEWVFKNTSSLSVNFHMALIGAALSILILALGSPSNLPQSTVGWMALVGALVTFVLFFVCLFSGIERIGALPAAMIMNVEPVAAMTLAILILGESFSAPRFVGAAIIVVAIVLVQYSTASARLHRAV